MASELLTFCDALVTNLNAAEFSTEISATRGYLAFADRKDLTEPLVLVVPQSVEYVEETRGKTKLVFKADIALIRKVDTDAESDEMVELAEEISLHCLRLALGDNGEYRANGVAQAPIYDPKQLETNRKFISVVTVTAWTWKDVS